MSSPPTLDALRQRFAEIRTDTDVSDMFDFGADLLTMGAYSHSRLRQLILGGVTRHVLENADIPVLMCR